MVKFPEAQTRLFRNKFVCRRCKTAAKTSMMQIMAGKITCKKCGSRALRPIRKK